MSAAQLGITTSFCHPETRKEKFHTYYHFIWRKLDHKASFEDCRPPCQRPRRAISRAPTTYCADNTTMDKDEVQDNGIPVAGLSDKDVLETAEERLKGVGNLVGDISHSHPN